MENKEERIRRVELNSKERDFTVRRTCAKLWYNFHVLSPQKSIIRGSYSMNDKRFKPRSRGNQAASSSVVAIVLSRLFEPKDWTKYLVDEILEHGDKLFRISQARNRISRNTYMAVDYVYPEFFIGDYKCTIFIEGKIIYGNLFSEGVGCPDITEGLQRFFKVNDAGVVTVQNHSVAIWRRKDVGFFYYDTSPRGEDGTGRQDDGVACLIRFERMNELRDTLLCNFNTSYDSRYCIAKVSVLRIVPISRGIDRLEESTATDPTRQPKLIVKESTLRAINPANIEEGKLNCIRPMPTGFTKMPASLAKTKMQKEPLSVTVSNYNIDERFAVKPLVEFTSFATGYSYSNMRVNVPSTYQELPCDMAVLRGWTHEGSEIYKGKGAQTVTNCIASIAMKRIYAAETWHRSKLDDILALGDAYYAKVKADKPTIKTLTAADLNDTKLRIEGKTLVVDVDVVTIVGTITSRVPAVLTLKQALEEFFRVDVDGIIECTSMAVATWSRDNCYYTFDPRQCDSSGVRITEGKTKDGGKSGGDGKGKGGGGEKGDTATVGRTKGKCCVVRFPNIDTLVGLFLKNVHPTRKNDRFTIRRVTVVQDVPGTRTWNDFEPIEPGVWILRGRISNDDASFEDSSRGIQGPAIPVVGLVNAKETPPERWTSELVDETIRDGDAYFNWCVPSQLAGEEEGGRDVKLLVSNLKRNFYMKNRKVNVECEESSVVGDLRARPDCNQLDLLEGLEQFFRTRRYGVLQVKDSYAAIWKFEEELADTTRETAYYCLVPSPRGNIGLRNWDRERKGRHKKRGKGGKQQEEDEEEEEDETEEEEEEEEEGDLEEEGQSKKEKRSSGYVIRVLDLAMLKNAIAGNASSHEPKNDSEFTIHEIKIQSIGPPMTEEELERDKSIPVKPELGRYTALGDDGACLNGNFDQANEAIFGSKTRDKQQAANALVMLGMTKLYNPHLWYEEVIDEVLKIGDKVTLKNQDNLPDWEEGEGMEREEEEGVDGVEKAKRDYLLPNEIDPEFYVGINKMTVELEESAIGGRMSDLSKDLVEFFQNNTSGIFRSGNVIMPIWKGESVYFTMDPRGRDERGIPRERDGTAAVMWYTDLAALTNSIQASVGRADQDFTVDAVTIENAYETSVAGGDEQQSKAKNTWYNFLETSNGVWVISGTVITADERFAKENRNRQSAAIAAIAIVFSKVYSPRHWKAEVLDEVIVTGDELHSKCVARLGRCATPLINEIITEFFLSDRRIDLSFSDCVQAGDLGGSSPRLHSLSTGIERFFANHTSGAILSRGENMAIWKCKDFFYCVLPCSSIESDGSLSGTPRIVRFASVELMADYLVALLGQKGDYEITAVDVVDWDKLPPWRYDPSPAVRPSNLPPLNAFQRLSRARAILRGTVHQASDIFPLALRNRQTAASCIVALGMSVIKNPVTWTKKTLDEILAIGGKVHKETVKTLQPTKLKLKPEDIVRVFHVGVNVLTADVERATISGQVAVPPPKPEFTGKGGGKGAKKQAAKEGKGKAKGKKGKAKRERKPPPPPIMLEEGLRKFFDGNRAGVIVTDGEYMTAIWKDLGVYFMYDPRCRSDQGLPADDGTACLMWFACIEPLRDIILANINDESEMYGNYKIGRVIVSATVIEPLPCPVDFRPIRKATVPPVLVSSIKRTTAFDVETLSKYVDDNGDGNGLALIRGTAHMKSRCFSVTNRGKQSTAIAAVAIVMGLLYAPSMWTDVLIDSVLKYGDLLYTDCIRQAHLAPRNLSPGELLTVFIVGDIKANLSIHRYTTAGILHEYDLAEGLALFFENNCAGILHTTNLAVAVMQSYGKFYVYDPCPRDEHGGHTQNGVACMIKCESIPRLARIFVENCRYKRPTVYTLNTVNVLSLHFLSDGKNECPPAYAE